MNIQQIDASLIVMEKAEIDIVNSPEPNRSKEKADEIAALIMASEVSIESEQNRLMTYTDLATSESNIVDLDGDGLDNTDDGVATEITEPNNSAVVIPRTPESPRTSMEKLASRAKDGDQHSLNELMSRCMQLTKMIIYRKQYYLRDGGNVDDLSQSAMLGIAKAYDPSKGPFVAFAKQIINRELIDTVKSAARLKRQPLDKAASLDEMLDNYTPKSVSTGLVIQSRLSEVSQTIINREVLAKLINKLSDIEKTVVELYIQGYAYIEITDITGYKSTTIDNALQRTRVKLKKAFAD